MKKIITTICLFTMCFICFGQLKFEKGTLGPKYNPIIKCKYENDIYLGKSPIMISIQETKKYNSVIYTVEKKNDTLIYYSNMLVDTSCCCNVQHIFYFKSDICVSTICIYIAQDEKSTTLYVDNVTNTQLSTEEYISYIKNKEKTFENKEQNFESKNTKF